MKFNYSFDYKLKHIWSRFSAFMICAVVTPMTISAYGDYKKRIDIEPFEKTYHVAVSKDYNLEGALNLEIMGLREIQSHQGPGLNALKRMLLNLKSH